PIRQRCEQLADAGRRVVLLARSEATLSDETLPEPLTAAAYVVFDEQIRPDAADTIRYFAEQGVACKVMSGDSPRTVGAIAARVGIDGPGGAVDGRELPDDPDALGTALESASVVGRVTPQQKRAIVDALQRRGHVVAMTGDGVNDALALKDADLGIAMGSGAAATRGTAKVVLLDDDFGTLPHLLAEGRRVLGNIERVGRLFLVKTSYSVVLALLVGVAHLPFPLLPRHVTLIGSLTIGIPGFFLALAPNTERARPGFV